SYATEKLDELTTLKEGLTKGAAAIEAAINEAKQARLTLKEFAKGTNADFTAERNNLSSKDFKRPAAFEERLRIQNESLELPLLPTTTIGSFPQSAEVRSARQKWRKNEWTDAE
ncbi:5-methyltetrahydropteroyltriglutamate--homocysteine S-methyltransferase, partial [Bacillus amyloliquefaciens]|nr:5-methyltetrahydropteroyltriglutamate--homocysteine S-methyltransferase [Bacillus amyloliquefaciens]